MSLRPARRRSSADPTAIAIIGVSCRLPGAASPDAFWSLLEEGRDAVTTLPGDRFAQAAFLHPRRGEPARSYSFAAGTLGAIDGFDAAAFGISPREAAEMDPQQRLLLELAHEAMEDAGSPPSAWAGSGTGVFVGASLTDYADLRLADPAAADRWFMTGGALSILANRLGNVFDLRGPAQTIDTACSSGLVALHLAAEALRAGRLPAALVGGVNLLLSPYPFLGFARAGMLSPSGRCRAFDAGADGYVRAEGGVVLLLKRLPDALAAGDDLRGVILGTGSNAAGRTVGLSLPSGAAQQALIEQVLAGAGVAPERLSYFEAHGTGTAAGDPIEAQAIGAALGRARIAAGAPALPIGSAKANIGHTEPASGLVGLLKAVLVLERGRIPPSLHCATPNPAIDFAGLGLRVATAAEALPARRDAVIGVNSFGFGGTNACALLGPAPGDRVAPRRAAADSRHAAKAANSRHAATAAGSRHPEAMAGPESALPPLLLSAHSAAALADLARAWRNRLAATPASALPALLRGAARHRDLLPHRLAARGATPGALAAALAAAGEGQAARPRRIAFVFSGNGAQHAAMARGALAASPAFRDAVAAADAVLAPLLGWSPLARLEAGVEAEALVATDIAQPLLFAVQHGIVAALAAEGIRPDLCLGHSVGEVAAAAAAGLLGLADAARLIVARSRHQHATAGTGRMATLAAAAEEALPVLAACAAPGAPGLEIAAFNAPRALTVAGPRAALERLATLAAERQWRMLPLDLDYAFHSAAMEPVRAPLLAELAGLAATAPRVPMVSSVTGAVLAPASCDPGYWWRNLREPVRFAAAARAAARLGAGLFLEIGPNPVLLSYLRESLRDAMPEGAGAAEILPSLSRQTEAPSADPFPGIADRAFGRGADPRGGPAFAGAAARRGLPPTPFARQPTWWAATPEIQPFAQKVSDHPLLGFRTGAAPGAWTRSLDTEAEPWLADHCLAGQAVLPAAAMLEMALAAGAACHPEAAALEVSAFAILRALPLEHATARELRTTLDETGRFTLESRRRLAEAAWTLHATGQVAPLPRLPEVAPAAPLAVPLAAPLAQEGAAVRARAAAAGLHYGPAFQGLVAVAADAAAGRGEAQLDRPEAAPPDDGLLLHPVRLDAALQAVIALLAETAPVLPGHGMVPVRVARLVARRDAAPAAAATLRLAARGSASAAADLVLRDAAGLPVALLEGAWLQRIRLPGWQDPAQAAFRVELVPADARPGRAAAPVPLGPVLAAAQPEAAAEAPGEAGMLLAGFCVAAAHRALLARGGAPAGPFASPLAAALLRELEAAGLAAPGTGGLRPVAAPDLPPPGAIWRQLLLEQPDLAPELALAAAAAEALPEALAGADPAPPPVPAGLAGLDALGGMLAASLAAFAAAWPRQRPLRVLEIGAASAGFTGRAIAALAGAGHRIRYCAASLPGGAAAADIPANAGSVEFDALAWDPLAGEAPPLAADLVIGLGAGPRLRAQGRAPAALPAALRQAVAPGATLLLAEPLPGPFWTLACGRHEAWWEGGAAALPEPADWQASLDAAGWDDGAARRLHGLPWPACLVAARVPEGATLLAAPVLRRVTLVAEAGAPLAAALAEALAARGAAVATEDLAAAAALPPRVLRNALVVALLPGREGRPAEIAARLVALGRLAEAAAGAAAGLCLVTAGGPKGEALAAAGRVLANEHPGLALRRLTVAARLPSTATVRRLAAEILAEAEAEPELTLTESGRLVPRLLPGLPPPPRPAGAVRLGLAQPGQLGSLGWAPFDPAPPGPGEVALAVAAAGLNFRDLMWAQGLLPEEILLDGFTGARQGAGLGMECAGTVTAVGEGVAGFRPGDRVFGIAPQALATHAVTRAEALAILPPGLDPAAAATTPVAFLTALLALEELARVEPGERVLIQGGAGSVGLAALQVALARGAEVAALAGTPERRAFLRQAGAALVLDSRDPGFADALRAHWPEGVDVVLNSVSGAAMERSLGLLRPFGRFVELGKRDFAEDRRMPMRPLRRNVTWFALDADEMARARPALCARVLADLARRLAEGALRPLPATLHGPEEAELAFRALQGSRRIGKQLLRPPAPPAAEARPAPAPLAEAARGTVVVVGGTRGFGLEAARWLAGQGVRHLALLSRAGMATPGIAAALAGLAALGAAPVVWTCDATEEAELAAVLARIRAAGPPVTGVVHAAAVQADGAAAALDPAQAEAVVAAKLAVAEHLDRLTAEDPVALFLLFSSAAVAVGNPGQAAYVAANAAIEAVARRRRAAGRPALAVRWGPIADAGVLAGEAGAATAETLQRRIGAIPMPAVEALRALPALLAPGCAPPGLVVAGVARMEWAAASRALRVLGEPCFAAVRDAAGPAGEGDLRAALAGADEATALGLLRDALAAELGRILRLPAGAVTPEATLGRLGLDSLGGMELRVALEQRLGVPVPLTAVTDTLTVETLARRIAAGLREGAAPGGAALLAAHEPGASMEAAA